MCTLIFRWHNHNQSPALSKGAHYLYANIYVLHWKSPLASTYHLRVNCVSVCEFAEKNFGCVYKKISKWELVFEFHSVQELMNKNNNFLSLCCKMVFPCTCKYRSCKCKCPVCLHRYMFVFCMPLCCVMSFWSWVLSLAAQSNLFDLLGFCNCLFFFLSSLLTVRDDVFP